MGVTISSPAKSIDLGYNGVTQLKITISKLIPCEEFVKKYAELEDPYRIWKIKGFESREAYFEDFDETVERICIANNLDEDIINFLFRPDCDCTSVSVKTCRKLWDLIQDYDDDYLYGYVGRKDCAKFADFKEIVRTCAQSRRVMRFS